MNQKLSNEEIKKIIHEIYTEEQSEHNLTININTLTLLEYFKTGTFRENIKLCKNVFSAAVLPFVAGGYNIISQDTIVIFIHHLKKIKKIENKIFTLILFCYHELRHQEQKMFDKFSYNGFLYNMDCTNRGLSGSDYFIEHPKYSFEIGAHLYSVRKAKDYLKKHYPDLYKKEKDYIEKLEQKYLFYYQTYDAAENIDMLINAIKTNSKELSKDKNKEWYEERLLPVLNIFLKEDFTPKSIYEIINNPNFDKLDKRIVYAFLSSKTFLESFDFEQLKEEELQLLTEALEYTNQIYQNQLELLQKEKTINLSEFLKIERNLLQKIKLINEYYSGKINHILNFRRNDRKKAKRMKSIPQYIEAARKAAKQKGYVTFSIFYIIGTLLSISTIIYLLIKK